MASSGPNASQPDDALALQHSATGSAQSTSAREPEHRQGMIRVAPGFFHADVTGPCGLCGGSRSLGEEQRSRILQGHYDLQCILCNASEASRCKDCFLPWIPEWRSRMDSEAFARYRPLGAASWLDNGETFLCYQCVAEKECQLDVEDQLAEDQKQHLTKVVGLAEELGRFPGVQLLSVQEICVSPRAKGKCDQDKGKGKGKK